MQASMYLSRRALITHGKEEHLLKYAEKCANNAYNKETNPEGIIDLGAAVNRLCEDIMQTRYSDKDGFQFSASNHLHIVPSSGLGKAKEAFSNFFTHHFQPKETIYPEELLICTGTSAAMDMLGHALLDEDDVIIVPTPVYGRTPVSFEERGLAKAYLWALPEEPDENGVRYKVNPSDLENIIIQLRRNGKNVRALSFITPNNPLGDVYDLDTIRKLLEICAKYEMHAIVDQLYAFSTYEQTLHPPNLFQLENLPDPERTHFIWGFSKDMCAIGFRVGVIHTRSAPVMKVLQTLSAYHIVPGIVQDAISNILNDTEWLDNVFFPTNQQRLKESYEYAISKLHVLDLYVKPAKAGFFLWVDLSDFLSQKTVKGEMELFEEFMEAKVYVSAGKFYFSKSPGWFRISIAQPPPILKAGLERFSDVILSKRMKTALKTS